MHAVVQYLSFWSFVSFIMAESIIQKLIDHSVVKVLHDVINDDNGNSKSIPIALLCSLCSIGRWKYNKNGHKPSKTIIVNHMKNHHLAQWYSLCSLYPVLDENTIQYNMVEAVSPSNSSTSSTDVSASSSPLIRRTSSKRSALSLDVMSTQAIQDNEVAGDKIEHAMNTVVAAFAVFNIPFKVCDSPLFLQFINAAYLISHSQKLYRHALKDKTIEYASDVMKYLPWVPLCNHFSLFLSVTLFTHI